MYNIIALIGKAGAGKDTLLRELLSNHPESLNEIISCTTRPPRQGEINGKNYHFMTEDEFFSLQATNQLIESTKFNNWYYGTPISSLTEDKINVGVFNPAGIRSLASLEYVNLIIIYVYVDDKTRLIRQLNREDYPNVPEIIRRYQADEIDFQNIPLISSSSFLFVPNKSKEDLHSVAPSLIKNKAIEVFGQW